MTVQAPSLLHQRLTQILKPLAKSYEIVFVDDRSEDTSWDGHAAAGGEDADIVACRLSKGFRPAARPSPAVRDFDLPMQMPTTGAPPSAELRLSANAPAIPPHSCANAYIFAARLRIQSAPLPYSSIRLVTSITILNSGKNR
jgi:hypothetical protein